MMVSLPVVRKSIFTSPENSRLTPALKTKKKDAMANDVTLKGTGGTGDLRITNVRNYIDTTGSYMYHLEGTMNREATPAEKKILETKYGIVKLNGCFSPMGGASIEDVSIKPGENGSATGKDFSFLPGIIVFVGFAFAFQWAAGVTTGVPIIQPMCKLLFWVSVVMIAMCVICLLYGKGKAG